MSPAFAVAGLAVRKVITRQSLTYDLWSLDRIAAQENNCDKQI